MPELEDAILHANFSGWYIYQLSQEESCNDWTCTLRAIAGGFRREIASGRGGSAPDAIHNALGAAPEFETETSVVNLRELDGPAVDLAKLFLKREPINRRL